MHRRPSRTIDKKKMQCRCVFSIAFCNEETRRRRTFMFMDEFELQEAVDEENDGLADAEEAAANMLEEGDKVAVKKVGQELVKVQDLLLAKPEQHRIGAGQEKIQLPNGGTFVQDANGNQTIFTGRAFNQVGNQGQLERVTRNADGSVTCAGEGATVRTEGGRTFVTTAGGDKIIIGPGGVESFRSNNGQVVDFIKKQALEQVQPALEKQAVVEKALAQQAAADGAAIQKLQVAAKAAANGTLDARAIDAVRQHFQGRNVDVLAKINLELQGQGSKFKVWATEHKGPNGEVKNVYRLSLRTTGEVIDTQSVRRKR